MKILNGISGIMSSRKGTLSLIITLMSGGLAATGHLDGSSLAAIVATVSSIFMWTSHRVDLASLTKGVDP